MQTIVEIPLTRPNPRHLVLGAVVEISPQGDSSGEKAVIGTISGLLVKKRQNYLSSEDPYQVLLHLRCTEFADEQEFDLDEITITYDPKERSTAEGESPVDSCVYLG